MSAIPQMQKVTQKRGRGWRVTKARGGDGPVRATATGRRRDALGKKPARAEFLPPSGTEPSPGGTPQQEIAIAGYLQAASSRKAQLLLQNKTQTQVREKEGYI